MDNVENAIARDAVDPLTLTIIRHKLVAIAEEMVETLSRTCFSSILNQSHDFSAMVTDGAARTLAQAERVPIHMGAMPFAIEAMAEAFADDLEPGDVLIANDPYAGGSHLPDLTMAMPVFVRERIVYWSCLRAHQGDIGGISAGSYSPSAREIWHEGLRVPPMKLIAAGKLRADVLALLALNSRKGEDLRGDVLAQIASVQVGAERLAALLERYGETIAERSSESILDAGEANMRSLLARCRPGRYRGTSHLETEDGKELIPVTATISIDGGAIEVDLRECPDQLESYLNSPIANTRAAVIVALLYLSGDAATLNDGAARPLTLRTRAGSLVDPREPGPVAACTSLTASAIIEAVLMAMAEALPEAAIAGFARRFRFTIAGTHQDGSPFIWHSFFNRGGAGANSQHDGWPNLGGIHNPGGTPSPSVEATESLYPLVIESYGLRPDSAGAGAQRGGLGGEIRIRYVGGDTATINATGEGLKVPPYGLRGGGPGAGHDYRILGSDGSVRVLGPRESGLPLASGDCIVALSAGGGGVGDPAERDRDAIERDERAGLMSPAHSNRLYRR